MAILGRPSQADEERAAAWRNWLQRQNPLAIAAFVLGALSLTHGGALIFDGVVGVGLGIIALVQLKRLRVSPQVVMADASPERTMAGSGPLMYEALPSVVPKDKGRGLAWGGIVLGGVSLVIAAYLYTHRPASAATTSTTQPATAASPK